MDRKHEVLVFLKAHGDATLADVAAHLGISKQGALRHVDALVAEGLVEATPSPPSRPGRPEHHYRVTAAARPEFPDRHRELAAELVGFVAEDELRRFFEARAARVERAYAAQLADLDFEGRVRELARLATASGHMAEVVETPGGGLAIRHCNCPIQDAAARSTHPCSTELAMYERLLGTSVERTSWLGAGDDGCTYDLGSAPQAPSGTPHA